MHDRSFKISKNQDATASAQLPLDSRERSSTHLQHGSVCAPLRNRTQKIQEALKQHGNTRKILASMLQDQEDALLPVLMATLNNEAQLCYENCQHARSNKCLELLETIIRRSPAVVKSKFSLIDNSIFMNNVCWHKGSCSMRQEICTPFETKPRLDSPAHRHGF